MSDSSLRSTQRFDLGWRFHLGDVPSPVPNTHIGAYMANKAGWSRGAAKGDFDDSDWRTVHLPHDWSIEGAFDPQNHIDAGFLPRGIGWYRRYFQLDESDRGRSIRLQFEGVATHCIVYVNGHLVHRHFCGYTPFTIDISRLVTFGDAMNTVSVKVDATYMEGWWYEGAGIYRHVWLMKSSPVRLADDGIFVRPARSADGSWLTTLDSTIKNDSDREVIANVIHELINSAGDKLATAARQVRVAAHDVETVSVEFRSFSNPRLWSFDTPNLYTVHSRLFADDKVVDEANTRFGYRTIRFDATEGFFINDQHVFLKGVCCHQDHAGVGVAVPDSIHEFRIRRLKELGVNAYRCAHHPPAAELLDACDRLGMLVMDENRNFGDSPEVLSQLDAMVLRDRNHPSVICWSICNEESIQGTPVAGAIARAMSRRVKQLDPTRPVTAAVSGGLLNDECITDSLELIGVNYQLPMYDPLHAKHPALPLLAAETHCVLATRGETKTRAETFSFADDDTEKATWGTGVRETQQAVTARKFINGIFIWTGFDYRGEPTPHEWPCVSSFFGLLDTCGFEKNVAYLQKAYFATEPFVQLTPHWTWPGKEGSPVVVRACTNCDVVEVTLNGRSLGRKPVDPIEMAVWSIPYEPGELRAVAWRGGERVAESSQHTAGPAAAIGMEVHPSAAMLPFTANGADALPITLFATDAAGRRCPTANHFITLSCTGPGRIMGTGNGDPTDHEPNLSPARRLFNGLAQAIVQSGDHSGDVTLTVEAIGLQPATLRLSVSTGFSNAAPICYRQHFISQFRVSPVFADRPDPNQVIAAPDMNSWEAVQLDGRASSSLLQSAGFVILRGKLRLPKSMTADGALLRISNPAAKVEVFVDGTALSAMASDSDRLEFPIPPADQARTVSILVHNAFGLRTMNGPIELLPINTEGHP